MADLIAPRRDQPYLDSRGLPTRRFAEYIEALTSQVNTSTDNTGEINTQLSSNQQALSLLSEVSKLLLQVVVTTASITAKPFETIVCNNTSNIEVTLPANPIKNDTVNIKRKNGLVKVIGDIDGKEFKIINVKYYSMKLVYDGAEWSEI